MPPENDTTDDTDEKNQDVVEDAEHNSQAENQGQTVQWRTRTPTGTVDCLTKDPYVYYKAYRRRDRGNQSPTVALCRLGASGPSVAVLWRLSSFRRRASCAVSILGPVHGVWPDDGLL